MEKIYSVIVVDKPGTLLRILLVFKKYDCMISTLSAARLLESDYFRITIVSSVDPHISGDIIDEIKAQINVVDIVDITEKSTVVNELVLVRIMISSREEEIRIRKVVYLHKASVLEVSSNDIIIEFSGVDEALKEFMEAVSQFNVKSFVKTGKVALLTEEVLDLPENIL